MSTHPLKGMDQQSCRTVANRSMRGILSGACDEMINSSVSMAFAAEIEVEEHEDFGTLG